jgi:hypothetical protein
MKLLIIRTDVSEDRIASIFRVHECEQVTERSCKLLYRHRLVGDISYGVVSQKMIIIIEELLDASFSIRSVSYRRKVSD